MVKSASSGARQQQCRVLLFSSETLGRFLALFVSVRSSVNWGDIHTHLVVVNFMHQWWDTVFRYLVKRCSGCFCQGSFWMR